MSCLSHCLKRFPLASFPRYYTSAAAARSSKPVASDTGTTDSYDKIKKCSSRPKKSKAKPEPPPLNSTIKDYLDKLAESSGELVLADIERYRPHSCPKTDNPDYENQYNLLLTKITGSFTVKQMRHFLKLYEIPLPSKKQTRTGCAVAIMEDAWYWPSLEVLREQKREETMGDQEFPLTPREAVLILGKDGAYSRSLSNKYRVTMTYQANPLSLRVRGFVGSLKQVEEHIAELKAAIAEEVLDFPLENPIRTDFLELISRRSGALTENFGQRQVRVSYNGNNPRSAVIAKRLVSRAVCEGNTTKNTPLFFHLPPSVPSSSPVPESDTFPHTYSLYPFSSPRPLPWTVSASGVFRVRRVEEWLGTGASEDLKKTGGLSMGRGRTVSLQQLDVDLRALLQAHHPSSKAVLASIGHLLLPSPLSGKVSLAPPLQGQLKLPQVMDWIGKRSEPTVFNPTLPTALLDAHPAQHRVLHRLVYHAIRAGDDVAPHKIIKMELDLPRSMKEPAISNEDFVEPKFHPSCWLGQKSDVNVMMLDRPADIQFSIFDSDILAAHQWPSELEQYISNLRAFLSYQDRDASQPETPLTVVHENVTYLLHSSLIVQQNVEHTEIDGSSTVKVITESAVDLEGDQKSASCQVICDDITPDLNWHSFLRQCDAMSTISPTSKRAPLL